jgi:hypothetical protein
MSIHGKTAVVARLIAICGLIVFIGGIVPTSVRAQEATPTPAAPGSLAAMLQLAPDLVSGAETPPVQIATYADLAAQTAVSGIPWPTSTDDPNFVPWAFALSPLIAPDYLFNYAMVADWHALLGINLWEIEQSLQTGEPPLVFTLLRGRFDEAAIRTAWTSQGYRMLDVDGIAVASLHEDASFDMTSDLGRFAFARFNNATILPDGTLAYSPTLDGMRAVIAAARGTAPSLGDRSDVAALVGAIAKPLASATLLAGNGLQQQPDPLGPDTAIPSPIAEAIASQVAESARMPPILMALLGVTAGGPLSRPSGETATPQPEIPPARFEIAVLLPSHDAAETAARVATERLATGFSLVTLLPLTDYFASWDAHALPDSPIAVLELDFAAGVQPRIWVEMIYQRDLVFLAW